MTVPFVLHGGFYDISRNAELRAELNAIEPCSDVVIDLCSTDFLDCSSIGTLVARLNVWNEQKAGTKLRLRNVSPQLVKVFRLLNLDNVFVLE